VTTPFHLTRGVRVADRLFVAALASGAAGIIHLSVVSEHLASWWGHGAFFLVVGTVQLASGVALVGHARHWLVRATATGNVVVVLVYVASRTVGVPVGPEHGGHQLEPSGPLDLAATAAEVLLIAALLPLLPARSRRITIDLLLVCGLALWLLRAVGRLG